MLKTAKQRKTELTPAERLTVRRALYEAIDSVKTSMDSFLPGESIMSAHEKVLAKKWKARVEQYKKLLEKMGGKPRGEIVSGFDLSEEE